MNTWLLIIFIQLLLIGCTCERNAIAIASPSYKPRMLIITADDFGASKNINDGIEMAANEDAITTISALSNFTASLPALVKISKTHPEIGIGVHLNITTGKPILASSQVPSLVGPDGSFYPLDKLLPVIGRVSTDELRKELRAQVMALAECGIRVDHLSDQYGIISFYGPFYDIMLDLAMEFKVPVRSPEIASIKFPHVFTDSKMYKCGRKAAFRLAMSNPVQAIRLLRYSGPGEMEKKSRKLDELGIAHPDLLIDCFWGNPTASNYLNILKHLPEGTSEIIVHCGTFSRQQNYPGGLDQEYFNNRENELVIITSGYLKQYYDYLKIERIGYYSLPADGKYVLGKKDEAKNQNGLNAIFDSK